MNTELNTYGIFALSYITNIETLKPAGEKQTKNPLKRGYTGRRITQLNARGISDSYDVTDYNT